MLHTKYEEVSPYSVMLIALQFKSYFFLYNFIEQRFAFESVFFFLLSLSAKLFYTLLHL